MNTEQFAKQIRVESLKMVHRAKASHIGGALSMADLLAVLYNDILQISPQQPNAQNRDRLLLSKGHACTSLYAALALKSFFPLEEVEKYASDGSMLMSHANHKVPGVELSTGSLGHALPVGCGMALAAKRKNQIHRIYVIVSDGELDEGSNWEAILFAAQHKLDNLTLIVDFNKIQSLGDVEDVISLHPLKQKFESFNWYVSEVDGHNTAAIKKALLERETGRPICIIADTIKGKGVDFMEGKLAWHYKSPSGEDLDAALAQLI